MVMAVTLMGEVVDVVAEGFKKQQERATFLSRREREQGAVRKAASYFKTVVPNALEQQFQTCGL